MDSRDESWKRSHNWERPDWPPYWTLPCHSRFRNFNDTREPYRPVRNPNHNAMSFQDEDNQHGSFSNYLYSQSKLASENKESDSPWSEAAKEAARKKELSEITSKLKCKLKSMNTEEKSTLQSELVACVSETNDQVQQLSTTEVTELEQTQADLRDMGRVRHDSISDIDVPEREGVGNNVTGEVETYVKPGGVKRTAHVPKFKNVSQIPVIETLSRIPVVENVPRIPVLEPVSSHMGDTTKPSHHGDRPLLHAQAAAATLPSVQEDLKRKMFSELMSMSKENLKRAFENPKDYPKIEKGMSHLIKETRIKLCQELRDLAEVRMVGRDKDPQFLNDAESLIDADLAVDLCKLPPELIKQIGDIFQLEFQDIAGSRDQETSTVFGSVNDTSSIPLPVASPHFVPPLPVPPPLPSFKFNNIPTTSAGSKKIAELIAPMAGVHGVLQPSRVTSYRQCLKKVVDLQETSLLKLKSEVECKSEGELRSEDEHCVAYLCSTDDEPEVNTEDVSEKPRPLGLAERLRIMEEMQALPSFAKLPVPVEFAQKSAVEGRKRSADRSRERTSRSPDQRREPDKRRNHTADINRPGEVVERRPAPADKGLVSAVRAEVPSGSSKQCERPKGPRDDVVPEPPPQKQPNPAAPPENERNALVNEKIVLVTELFKNLQKTLAENQKAVTKAAMEKPVPAERAPKVVPKKTADAASYTGPADYEKMLLDHFKKNLMSESLRRTLSDMLNGGQGQRKHGKGVQCCLRRATLSREVQTAAMPGTARETQTTTSVTDAASETTDLVSVRDRTVQTEAPSKVVRTHARTQTHFKFTDLNIYGVPAPLESTEEDSDSLLNEVKTIDQAIQKLNERKFLLFVKLTLQNKEAVNSEIQNLVQCLSSSSTSNYCNTAVIRGLEKQDVEKRQSAKTAKVDHAESKDRTKVPEGKPKVKKREPESSQQKQKTAMRKERDRSSKSDNAEAKVKSSKDTNKSSTEKETKKHGNAKVMTELVGAIITRGGPSKPKPGNSDGKATSSLSQLKKHLDESSKDKQYVKKWVEAQNPINYSNEHLEVTSERSYGSVRRVDVEKEDSKQSGAMSSSKDKRNRVSVKVPKSDDKVIQKSVKRSGQKSGDSSSDESEKQEKKGKSESTAEKAPVMTKKTNLEESERVGKVNQRAVGDGEKKRRLSGSSDETRQPTLQKRRLYSSSSSEEMDKMEKSLCSKSSGNRVAAKKCVVSSVTSGSVKSLLSAGRKSRRNSTAASDRKGPPRSESASSASSCSHSVSRCNFLDRRMPLVALKRLHPNICRNGATVKYLNGQIIATPDEPDLDLVGLSTCGDALEGSAPSEAGPLEGEKDPGLEAAPEDQQVSVEGVTERCDSATHAPLTDTQSEVSEEEEAVGGPERKYPLHFLAHTGPVADLKISGRHLMAACEDKLVYCYSLKDGKRKRVYAGHGGRVLCVEIHSESHKKSSTLLTGCSDGIVRSFSIQKSELLQQSAYLGGAVQCLEQNWGVVFAGLDCGVIARLRVKSLKPSASPMEVGKQEILALATAVEGAKRVVIVATRGSPVVMRDAGSGVLLRSLNENYSDTVYSLLVEANVLYCGCAGSRLPFFSISEGVELGTLDCGPSVVCMKLVEGILFASSTDGIYVFNCKTNQRIGIIPGPSKPITAIEVYKNNRIVLATNDSKLQVWVIPSHIRKLTKPSVSP